MQLNNRNVVLESVLSFVVFCMVSSSQQQQQQQRDLNNNNISNNRYYYVVDEGQNLTLPCSSKLGTVMWVREGKMDDGIHVLPNGSLFLPNLNTNDAGTYICSEMIPGFYESVNVGIEDNSVHNENFTKDTVVEVARIEVTVRSVPGPVAKFKCRATTIIAVIIWEIWPNRTGGYPLLDFTAEMRRMPEAGENETEWMLLDPHHISPNARQLEIFHLSPNTTYEFRIWGTNKLGPGEKSLITATTVPKTEEKDLLRRIMIDAENFDTRVWIVAVSIVMGSLLILSIGTCLILYKECRDSTDTVKHGDLDSVELVPNIILNPGFCESDNAQQSNILSPTIMRSSSPITTQTYYAPANGRIGGGLTVRHHHSHHLHTPDDDVFDGDGEEPMTFSRKMSIFFTGNTIKRI